MKKYILILSVIVFSVVYSCKEETIGTYSGDNYVSFVKEIKDTTIMSFFFYIEDEVEYPIEVKLTGNLLTKDTEYHLVADDAKTTLKKSLYTIPEKFIFRAGLLVDTAYVKLKNDPDLLTNQYLLQLKVKDGTELFSANSPYTAAVIFVSDRAERPSWWTLLYDANGNQTKNSVEVYYLGPYSRLKYEAFMRATGYTDLGKTPSDYRIRSVIFSHWLKEQNPRLTEEDGITLIEVPVKG